MLRKSLPVIKSTLLKTFKENFLDKGWQQYVKSFPETTFTLTWNNGSEILFMSENYDDDKDLNRFKGLEINGAFIDEVNEIMEVTYDKVVERAGSWFHSPGCPTKILLSCNPAQNWVKDKFYLPWKENRLPQGIAYIHARIYDNPHIPAAYMESLKFLPKYQYIVFVDGEWDIALKVGGEFYKCFELDQHVKKVAYNAKLPLHISWDDNVNPYLPCGIFQIEGLELRMIDEIAGINPKNTVKDVCLEFARRFPGHDAGLFVYGDATAQKEDTKMEKGHNFFRLILDNLAKYKPHSRVAASNPSVAMRGNWINTVFEKNIGGLVFTIGDNCKRTVNDFVQLKEAADGTKAKEKETDPKTKVSYQKVGHFTDLFDYIACSAFIGAFGAYQKGHGNFTITTGKNRSKNSY